MSRTDPQMKIRIPDDLKEAVETAAAGAGRTLNAEVVQRLTATFAVDGDVAALASQVEMLTAQRDDAYRAVRALQGTQEALAQLTLAVADLAALSKAAGAKSTISSARAVANALLAPLSASGGPSVDAATSPAPRKREPRTA